MKEIWTKVWNQIKELFNVKFSDIPAATKELGLAICNAIAKFLKFVWTCAVGFITGALAIVGNGLVATWNFLIGKWF